MGGGAVLRHLPVALPDHRADHAAQRARQLGPRPPPDRRHLGHRRPVLALHRTAGPARRPRAAVGTDPPARLGVAPAPTRRVGAGRSASCSTPSLCALGLFGVVAASAADPASQVTSIVPTVRHHRPTSTIGPTPPPGRPPPPPPRPPPLGQGVTAIGDSIMVDAAPYLQQLLPGIAIDAQVGQQLYQVQAAVPQLKAEGVVGNRLILELGTNGPYSAAQLQTWSTPSAPCGGSSSSTPGSPGRGSSRSTTPSPRWPASTRTPPWSTGTATAPPPAVLLSRRRPPRPGRGQVLRLAPGPGGRGTGARTGHHRSRRPHRSG